MHSHQLQDRNSHRGFSILQDDVGQKCHFKYYPQSLLVSYLEKNGFVYSLLTRNKNYFGVPSRQITYIKMTVQNRGAWNSQNLKCFITSQEKCFDTFLATPLPRGTTEVKDATTHISKQVLAKQIMGLPKPWCSQEDDQLL